MGLRGRVSRKNRRRQRARARRKRHEEMMEAALRCAGCGSVLVRDGEAGLDIWECGACGKTFLRVGPRWITELGAEPLFLPTTDFLRGAGRGELSRAA